MIPTLGGVTPKFSNAFCPHFRNSYRSRLRSNSMFAFLTSAIGLANSSTCTLWSITRSTGTSGLIACGSPPARFIALRIAARSTTHGTPVKSCRITRAGLNGISAGVMSGDQSASARTASSPTSKLSMFRSALSSSTRMLNGSLSTSVPPPTAAMSKYVSSRPPLVSVRRLPSGSWSGRW